MNFLASSIMRFMSSMLLALRSASSNAWRYLGVNELGQVVHRHLHLNHPVGAVLSHSSSPARVVDFALFFTVPFSQHVRNPALSFFRTANRLRPL